MDQQTALQRLSQAVGLSAHQTIAVLQRDPDLLAIFAELHPIEVRTYHEGGVPIAGILTGATPIEKVQPHADGVNLTFAMETRRGDVIRMSTAIRWGSTSYRSPSRNLTSRYPRVP